MRLIHLARKDLDQVVRDRRSLLFLVLMPLVFTVFLGMAFRWSGVADTRPLVALVNFDSTGSLSQGLAELLDSSEAVRVLHFAMGETVRAEASVKAGRLDALLLIPAGYSDGLLLIENRDATVFAAKTGGVPIFLELNSSRVQGSDERGPIRVICDENSIAGQAALRSIQVVVNRVRSAGEIGQQVESESDSVRRMIAVRAIEAWRHPAFTVSSEKAVRPGIERKIASSFDQASPGTLVQFAIFGLMTSAMLLVLERKSRVLPRLLTTSISRAEVIAGHLLAMFAVTFLQGVILIVAGQLLFHVHYFAAILSVLLVMVMLAWWVAALGLLIGSTVHSQEQVTLWSMIGMFVFSAMGGAWFPLDVTGKTFAAIGHLLPSAWAMDGFQNVIVRGLGLSAVLLPCGVMFGYGLLFFALALWRLGRSELVGG
jgi:ABC-2 type transport system permease protein